SASLCLAGRYDESLEQARNLIELDPNFWAGHWALGVAYAYKGEYRKSIVAYEKANELDNSPMIRGALADVYARSGKTDEARAILDELKSLESQSYVPPYYLALIHLALGETDEAFEYLERAYVTRDGSLPLIKVDQRLESISSDPRLIDLMLR